MKMKLLLLLLVSTMLCVFSNAALAKTADIYSDVEVRLSTEIMPEKTERLMDVLNSAEDENSIELTFYNECKTEITTAYSSDLTTLISVYGENISLFPINIIVGRYPAFFEENVCIVSSELAWELWGSNNILGQQASVNESSYKICGVFDSKEKLTIVRNYRLDGYTSFELNGKFSTHPALKTQQIVSQLGIESEYKIINFSTLLFILKFICYLPLLLLTLTLCLLIYKATFKSKNRMKGILIALLAVLTAFAIPALLQQIPPWYLPNRWSDFSFWNNFLRQATLDIQTYFSINPLIKDIDAKWLLCEIILFSMSSIICMILFLNSINMSIQNIFHNQTPRINKNRPI